MRALAEQKQGFEALVQPGGVGQNAQMFYQQEAPLLKGVVTGRPMFAQVDVYLNDGEKVVGDAGAMTWYDGQMPIETSMKGGCGKSFARSCAGESCCLNEFTGPGRVGFAFDLPGDIMAFAVTPQYGWILNRGAFICGTSNLNVSARFAGCCACLFSDEGPFLTKVTCENNAPGIFYAGGFGAIKRHDLHAGQVLFVDNGMFFAAEQKTKIEIGMVGGVKATCCSGEGLVMKFYGPCTIFTQSRDPSLFDPLANQQDRGNADS